MGCLDVTRRHRRVFRKWWRGLSYDEKVRFKECVQGMDVLEILKISSAYEKDQSGKGGKGKAAKA
jgi:hypothetical protein